MADQNDDKPTLQLIQGGSAASPTIAAKPDTPSLDELATLQEASGGSRSESTARVLVELTSDLKLFHTPDHVAHVTLEVDGRRETWPVRSAQFKQWLRHCYFEATNKPPASQALEDTLGVLEAKAQFRGDERETYIRVGNSGGVHYLDLARTSGSSIVRIAPGCWELVDDAPVLFWRPQALKPLPAPTKGGSIHALRPFVNIEDDQTFQLFEAWLVAAILGLGPVPALVIQGQHGSAKSTLVKIIRHLIDPAKGLLRSQPRSEQDLAIAASRSWLLSYDNLSDVPPWFSDGLCRVVTGGAYASRELYTNGEEIIFEFRRVCILNGIDELVTRPDLLDRALVVRLLRIDEEDRKDDDKLWSEFMAASPMILGALLDLAASALSHLPNVVLTRKPRMADFARLGVAVEMAMGSPAGTFMSAYRGNRSAGNHIAIAASLIGPYVRTLAAQPGGWQSTPQALLNKLDDMFERARSGLSETSTTYFSTPGHGANRKKPRGWPANAQQLSVKLLRIAPNLAETGVEVETGQTPGPGSERFIRLFLKNPSSPSVEPGAGADDSSKE